MARRRYGRKRKGGKSKSIPLAVVLPVLGTAASAYGVAGFSKELPNQLSLRMTGFSLNDGSFDMNRAKGFWLGEVIGIVIHKVANKTGVNKHVRKLSMGWLSI